MRGRVCGNITFRIGGFMSGFDIFAIALVILGIITLFAGVKTVPQGYDWTIERFGKYTRTLSPGLNLITPYYGAVGGSRTLTVKVVPTLEPQVVTGGDATGFGR